MSDQEFLADFNDALDRSKRDAKAWLGALQHVVYSQPPGSQSAKKKEPWTVEYAHEKKSEPLTSINPNDDWMDRLQGSVDAVFYNAKSALGHQHQKRRSPHYKGEQDELRFSDQLEAHVRDIVAPIMRADVEIMDGRVPENRLERQAFTRVTASLENLAAVFSRHSFHDTLKDTRPLLAARKERADDNQRGGR